MNLLEDDELDPTTPTAPLIDAQGNQVVADDRKRRIQQYLEDAQKRSQSAKTQLLDNTVTPDDRFANEQRQADRSSNAALFSALDFTKNKNNAFGQYAENANKQDAASLAGQDARAQQASTTLRQADADALSQNNATQELDKSDLQLDNLKAESAFKQDQQGRTQELQSAEDDPTSPISVATRTQLKKLAPNLVAKVGTNFDSMSATQAKQLLNPAEATYKIDQASKDRAESRADKLASKADAQETKKGANNTRREDAIRQQYMNSPAVKDANNVNIAYDKVKAAASNPTAAGDLSLIFGYMKMLDPGSTVREGEFANAQNAAGLPDQVRNKYNQVMSGQRLNPTQRQDFVQQAGKVNEAQRSAVTKLNKQYEDFAAREGLNTKNIIFDIGAPSEAPTSSAPVAAPKQGTEEEGYTFLGGDPADQKNWKKK